MKNLKLNGRILIAGSAAIIVVAVIAAANLIGQPNFRTIGIIEHPIYTGSGGVTRNLPSCTRATDCDVVGTVRNDGGPASGRAIFSAASYNIFRQQQADAQCEAPIPQTAQGASVQVSCRLAASAGNYLEDPVTLQVTR